MAAKAPIVPRHRIVSIVGTRPEAIKMAPILRVLAGRPIFEQQLILTGQHPGLADGFDMLPGHAILDLAVNSAELSAGELGERLHDRLCGALAGQPIDLVLVQGDTTTALAGALAARDCGLPLGHIEAGLRSFDLGQPWPEEGNRIRIDEIASLLFAPTETAARNLSAEPCVRGRILVTGNSGIDAVFHARNSLPPFVTEPSDRNLLLVTCHRRENRGAVAARICDALQRLAASLPIEIVLPLHPNRSVRDEFEQRLRGVRHISLIEPVNHAEMVRLIERSWAILTDSGGLQEEGPAIGRPVLVIREVTERHEADANLELVGTEPDRIVAAVTTLLSDEARYARMATPSRAFGDGRAAPRIVEAIELWLTPARYAVGL